MSDQIPPSTDADQLTAGRSSEGIGRFKWTVGTGILACFVYGVGVWLESTYHYSDAPESLISGTLRELGLMQGGFALLAFPVLAAQSWLFAQRMKNIGLNPWWSLAVVVPVLNFGLGLVSFVSPEGYRRHKRFDYVAKFLMGVVGYFLLLVLVLFGIGLFSMGHWHAPTDPAIVWSMRVLEMTFLYSMALVSFPFMFGVFSLIGDVVLLVGLVFVVVSNKISCEIYRGENS